MGRSLETQLSEMETRLADAEEAAIRSGKATMTKLENRIRELEAELGTTQAHTSESMKAYQRTKRKEKNFCFLKMKIAKTRKECQSLQTNFSRRSKLISSRLRRLKKLLLLILQNSEKHNRN